MATMPPLWKRLLIGLPALCLGLAAIYLALIAITTKKSIINSHSMATHHPTGAQVIDWN